MELIFNGFQLSIVQEKISDVEDRAMPQPQSILQLYLNKFQLSIVQEQISDMEYRAMLEPQSILTKEPKSLILFFVQTHPNNATSRIAKDRKESKQTKLNEARYKYLRPWAPMNNFH